MPSQFPTQSRMVPQGYWERGGQMSRMNQMPPNRMIRPMMRTPQYPMMHPMMRMPQQKLNGGGLFSRIFGRGNQGSGMNGLMGMRQANRAAGGSGSFLQSLTNPGGLSSFLNNTQQVLKTAQTIGPMIQQYGPIVKNLPALWKLYRGLKNASDKPQEESSGSSSDKTSESIATTLSKDEKSSKDTLKTTSNQMQKRRVKDASTSRSSKEKGASIPKLYI